MPGVTVGGESEAAWRTLIDDLVKRGLMTPDLVIVDGAPDLEKALAALWSDMPLQRCTVHTHRDLHAYAPDRQHEDISTYYNDMIYSGSKPEIEAKRKAFIRKWRLKCRAVADSLEEAGDKLFTVRVSRKASANRSGHQIQLNVCTKSSSGVSRHRPCCHRRKPRRCCFGHCWLLVRS
jgi:transposase-like protein